jgi:hypothetical protein
MNADSSRSHMVFTVRLTVEGGAARKLTFCDLGGCERRATWTWIVRIGQFASAIEPQNH